MLARLKMLRSPTGRSLSVWQLPSVVWGTIKFVQTTAVVCGVERTSALAAAVKILSGAGAVLRRKAEVAFAEKNTEANLREKGHHAEKGQVVAFATDLLAATRDRLDDAADGKDGCLGEAWKLFSGLVVLALAGRRVADHAAAAAATLLDALLNPAFDGTTLLASTTFDRRSRRIVHLSCCARSCHGAICLPTSSPSDFSDHLGPNDLPDRPRSHCLAVGLTNHLAPNDLFAQLGPHDLVVGLLWLSSTSIARASPACR